MVPVGEDARFGRREILLQEVVLRGSLEACDRGAVGVQRDQVPGTEVEAVVARAYCPRGPPLLRAVIGLPLWAGALVRVVAEGRKRDRRIRSPRGVVPVQELGQGPVV